MNKKKTGPTDEHLTRVIQMHEKKEKKAILKEPEIKYSGLLLDLIKPYCEDFADPEELEVMLDLGISTWNLANLKELFPNVYKTLLEQTIAEIGNDRKTFSMLETLISEKSKHFSEYDKFLSDFKIEEGQKGELQVTVISKPVDLYMDDLIDEVADDSDDFDEDYTGRTALVIVPNEAFLGWLKQRVVPDLFANNAEKGTVYLIPEMDNAKEVEKWLKKNFESILSKELDGLVAMKDWPQKTTYKLFREWFSVEIHSRIIDLDAPE